MVEIINTEVFGLEKALHCVGYPMKYGAPDDPKENPIYRDGLTYKIPKFVPNLGSCKMGTGHDGFLRNIIVQGDIKYSGYFTPQLQRYHFFEMVSSQSKMHTLTKRLDSLDESFNKYTDQDIIDRVKLYIVDYNNETDKDRKYYLFMKIMSNLPSSIEQWCAFSTNYLQLKTIYHQRKTHKLQEDWGYFCNWVKELPFFEEICLNSSNKS